MQPALVVKLRPTGPWRLGPDSGARNQVDNLLHSDALYGAVCWAMLRLGRLEEWLEATARASHPAVRFSSCFPLMDDLLFVIPPLTIWPPPPAAAAARVRWKSARFIPREMVGDLLAGHAPAEDQWHVDAVSGCLLPAGRSGPFRGSVRSHAAVDRLSGVSERHSVACLEFRPGAGWWAAVAFQDGEQQERWAEPVRAAFRLLADSGIGGERARGWGRSDPPEFSDVTLPDFFLPPVETPSPAHYWLLSLYAPAPDDAVDWTQGNYATVTRTGRVDGSGHPKKALHMIAEGSVVRGNGPPAGLAPDVAPDGFAHPVYRSGFALAIPLPPQAVP